MHAREVAERLERLADLVEIVEEGEAARKAAAYRRAAQTLERQLPDLVRLRAEGRLTELPGVGPAIARKIEEILDRGTCRALEELERRVPPGVLELLAVPGIGPRTAGLLYRRLGIAGLEDLRAAAEDGRLAGLPGFGGKRVEHVRRQLERLRRQGESVPLAVALAAAEAVRQELAAAAGVEVAVVGGVRRGRDLVEDVDLLAAAADPAPVTEALCRSSRVTEVRFREPARARVVLEGRVVCDLRVAAPEAWPSALQAYTGSAAHNARLRELARRRGYRLEPEGLFPLAGGRGPLPLRSEEELYAALGLAYVPPELREDAGEIEAAQEGRLPELIRHEHIRGDLHVHTDWSDGRASLEAMCAAARARGYEYVAITDHSPSLAVARGLSPDRLRRQLEEIAALRERFPDLLILTGAEVDIRPDGSLDLPEELLAQLDVVVASVHSRLGMAEPEMTARLLAAMESEHVDILGHPTGRILGYRDPYPVDVERLLEAAVRTRTVLELNASPERLDLAAEQLRRAKALGARFAINTDAHAPEGYDAIAYGILTARRGWLEPGDVINTLPAVALREFLRRPKRARW